MGDVAFGGKFSVVVLNVALVGSLTLSVMKTPLGLPVASVTGNCTDEPGPTTTFDGSWMALDTVTEALAAVTPVGPLARIVVVPIATALTVTFAVLVFAGITTLAGTVAVPTASLDSVTVSGFFVAADRLTATDFVPPIPTVKVFGLKLSEAVTLALVLPEV